MKKHSIFLTVLLIIGSYAPIKGSSKSTNYSVEKIVATAAATVAVVTCMPFVYVEGTNWYRHYQQRQTHSLSFEEECLQYFGDTVDYPEEELEKVKLFCSTKVAKKIKVFAHLGQLCRIEQQNNAFVPEVAQAMQAIAQIDLQLTNAKDAHISRRIATSTPINPNGELAKVCTKIMGDMGIGSDCINIRWLNRNMWLRYKIAFYDPTMNTIFLNPNVTAQQMIRALPHEFQHHRQKQFYEYTQKLLTVSCNMEHDADATMASYITCYECLQDAANCTLSEKGYFSKEDFQPYIQEAQTKGTLCHAHSFPGNCQKQPSLMDYLPT